MVTVPAVCESTELRTFLSRDSPFMVSERNESVSKPTGTFPGTDLVRHVYNSVAGSIDDMFFGPSFLVLLVQRLTRQPCDLAGLLGNPVSTHNVSSHTCLPSRYH